MEERSAFNRVVVGSTPTPGDLKQLTIAQLVEQGTVNEIRRSCMKKTINLSALHIMAEDKRKGIETEARPFFNTASYLQRSLGRWFKSSW